MNDIIKRLASEAGFDVTDGGYVDCEGYDYTEEVERFAALVAEECARIAAVCRAPTNEREEGFYDACKQCAGDIRAAFPMPKG